MSSAAPSSHLSSESDSLTSGSPLIEGVIVKPLKTHRDERGFFREIVRCTDPFFEGADFAQWSHSRMVKDVVKAWHYHHVQIDWWYVGVGSIHTVLFDNRPESPTYRQKMSFNMGDATESYPQSIFGSSRVHEVCIKIPPGVLHGLKVLSSEAQLFYITSVVYSPNEEGRFPYNSDTVPHDWGTPALTVENDRRAFVPTSTRIPIR
jgi:dTDP-4-dehydrorhamnose 3,5-epimerase